MTASRRSRRRTPVSTPEERLRALGLDSSPSARRLRARIPRPPADPATVPVPRPGTDVPSAPYAVRDTRTPYRPAGRDWPERAPEDVLTVPAPAPVPGPGTKRPEPTPSTDEPHTGSGPWRDPGRRGRSVPDRPTGTSRPPAGYTELVPDEPAAALDRITRGWATEAALSRRSLAVLVVLGLLAVGVAFLMLRERPEEVVAPELVTQAASDDAPPAASGAPPPDDDAPDGEVVVHVGGEVNEPGLYTMPAGSRVADAVEEAGGALPDADLDLLNLARTLTDGERVLVGVPQEEIPGDGGAAASGGEGATVNINTADEEELRSLPGIGEKKARQIIDHRESIGGSFASVEDLLGVDGIAEKTLENLRPHVTVG
ncbi:helix-hairpin-helix domain-containing protein [Nocardiopsis sp. NPDC006832]|uniref:helix-hairpin-helix domain-containing protein n=1 Tax=Nocardiopsis sp. NPDC006832 TaxID=3157188 RepID=UPI0033CB5391